MLNEDRSYASQETVKFIIVQPDGGIRQSGALQRQNLEKLAVLYSNCRVMEVPASQYRLDIDATSYVRDGVITPKGVALDVTEYDVRADGVDRASFAVPAGTSVIHAGEIAAIEDNVFEFTTDVLGDHHFSFIAPVAFHHFEVTIHAV
jgi:hypothetical protein